MTSSPMNPAVKAWKGKVAFVSGGASGIGLGIAQALAARGALIALSDIRKEPLDAACAGLRAGGAQVLPIVLDVADRAAVQHAADTVVQHFGEVHYVFNNAGVGELGTPIDQQTQDVFDWVFNVNVRGVFNAIQAFVPRLREQGQGGYIVNTASMAGLTMQPGWHMGLYSGSKRALYALTVDLRAALEGTGIGVALMCPGAVKSELADTTVALRPKTGRAPPPVPPMLAAANADMLPRVAGEVTLAAMERGDFLILTHPQHWPHVAREHEQIHQAFEAAALWVPGVVARAQGLG